MNKLCRLIVITSCVLTMFTTTATPRLKVKPSLSISLNKRSICAEVENKYYLNSLAGTSGIINNFAKYPFSAVGSEKYQTDHYLGPGFTYIEDNTFILKKSGAAKANAKTTDAIDGDKLLTLIYTADVQNLGYIATNGQLLFPIESVETTDAVSTLTMPYLRDSWDGLTELNGTFSYTYVDGTGTNKHLEIRRTSATKFNYIGSGGVGSISDFSIKKYYSQDSSKKYYIVMGAYNADYDTGGTIPTTTNNFNTLVTYTPANDANTYTQMDYEHVDYYGVTLGLTAEYALTDSIYIDLQTDLTTPIENIEHTGKFVSVRPEADIAVKGGLSFGNSNGTIGFLYGVTYDRYTTILKRFNTPVGGRYLEVNETQLRTFAVCREINANIRLNSQIDAHFSTILTDSDYKVDLKGSNKRSPVTDQRFAFGFSMNY